MYCVMKNWLRALFAAAVRPPFSHLWAGSSDAN